MNSDKFFFLGRSNLFSKKKFEIISQIIVKRFLIQKGKESKNSGKKNFSLPTTAFSKTFDSFPSFSLKMIWNGFLNLEKKLNCEEKIKILFLNIFSRSVFRQNFWRIFPYLEKKTMSKNEENVSKIFSKNSKAKNFYCPILFLKKNFFTLIFLILDKFFGSLGKIIKNITISCGFFFLSKEIFTFLERLSEKDFEEKQNHKIYFKFLIFFSSFIYSKSRRQHKDKISPPNFIFVGNFIISKKKINQAKSLRIFLGVFKENKKKIFIDLNLNSDIFCHFIYYLMAKYQLKKIFFSKQTNETNLPKDLIGICKNFFKMNLYNFKSHLGPKFDYSIFLLFKKNIQYIKLKDSSFIYKLASSNFIRSFSKCSNESVFNSILVFFEVGAISIYLIFIFNKKKKGLEFNFKNNKTKCDNFKNTVFFTLEKFLSQIQHIGKLFSKNPNLALFSKFVCNVESKKIFKMSEISKDIELKKEYGREKFPIFFFGKKNNIISDLYKCFEKQFKRENNSLNLENKKNIKVFIKIENKNLFVQKILVKSSEYDSWETIHYGNLSKINLKPVKYEKQVHLKDCFFAGLIRKTTEVTVEKKYISKNFLIFGKILISFIINHPIKIQKSNFQTNHFLGSLLPTIEKYKHIYFFENEQLVEKNKNFSLCKKFFRIFYKKNLHPKIFRKNFVYCFKLLQTKFYFLKKNNQFKEEINLKKFSGQKIEEKLFNNFYKKKIAQKLNKSNENYFLDGSFKSFAYKSIIRTNSLTDLTGCKTMLKKILANIRKNYLFLRTSKTSIILVMFLNFRISGFLKFLFKFWPQGKLVVMYHTNRQRKKFFYKWEESLKKVKKRIKKFIIMALYHENFIEKGRENLNFVESEKNSKKKFFFKFFKSKNKKKQFEIIYGSGFNHYKDFFCINFFGYEFRNKIFSYIDEMKKYLYLITRHNICLLI